MPESNRHDHRSPLGWLLARTVLDAAFVGSLIWALAGADWSEGLSSWATVIVLPLVLLSYMIIKDNVKLWRARAALSEAISAYAAEVASNTGVWRDDLGEVVLTVRWDGVDGHYWVKERPIDQGAQGDPWMDSVSLARHIEAAETNGLVPDDNEATRAIRARLMVPGWDRFDREDAL